MVKVTRMPSKIDIQLASLSDLAGFQSPYPMLEYYSPPISSTTQGQKWNIVVLANGLIVGVNY